MNYFFFSTLHIQVEAILLQLKVDKPTTTTRQHQTMANARGIKFDIHYLLKIFNKVGIFFFCNILVHLKCAKTYLTKVFVTEQIANSTKLKKNARKATSLITTLTRQIKTNEMSTIKKNIYCSKNFSAAFMHEILYRIKTEQFVNQIKNIHCQTNKYKNYSLLCKQNLN